MAILHLGAAFTINGGAGGGGGGSSFVSTHAAVSNLVYEHETGEGSAAPAMTSRYYANGVAVPGMQETVIAAAVLLMLVY